MPKLVSWSAAALVVVSAALVISAALGGCKKKDEVPPLRPIAVTVVDAGPPVAGPPAPPQSYDSTLEARLKSCKRAGGPLRGGFLECFDHWKPSPEHSAPGRKVFEAYDVTGKREGIFVAVAQLGEDACFADGNAAFNKLFASNPKTQRYDVRFFQPTTKALLGDPCKTESLPTPIPGTCDDWAEGPAKLATASAWMLPMRVSASGELTEDGHTLSCASGAVALCVHYGYVPDEIYEPSLGMTHLLSEYFRACVLAVTGAFTASLHEAKTCPVPFEVIDRLGVRRPRSKDCKAWRFEAAWGSTGIVAPKAEGKACARTRYDGCSPKGLERCAEGTATIASFDDVDNDEALVLTRTAVVPSCPGNAGFTCPAHSLAKTRACFQGR